MDQERFTQLTVALNDEGVLTVSLNRPEKLNALTPVLMDELVKVMADVHQDDSVRVVVLTGSGRAFSAGGDIHEDAIPTLEMTDQQYQLSAERFDAPILAITELDRPVIAAVNGLAVGGGWDLAMACDIRIASTDARFKNAYVQLGIVPELGGTWLLPRLVGLGRAKLIAFTGDWVQADDAKQMGLVEEVVRPEDLETYVADLASRISQGPARAIAMTKLAMHRAMTSDLRQAIDYASALAPALIANPDHAEALNAFVERRPPVFNGTIEDRKRQ